MEYHLGRNRTQLNIDVEKLAYGDIFQNDLLNIKITDEQKAKLDQQFLTNSIKTISQEMLLLINSTALRIENRSLRIQENFNRVAKILNL